MIRRKRETRSDAADPGRDPAVDAPGPHLTQRSFLKLAGATLGAGLLGLVGAPGSVEATYTPGPPDTINTTLIVEPTPDDLINGRASLQASRGTDNYLLLSLPGVNAAGLAHSGSVLYLANQASTLVFRTGVTPDGDWTTTGLEGLRIVNGQIGIGGVSTPTKQVSIATGATDDGVWLTGSSATFVALLANLTNGAYCSLSQANDRAIIYGGSAIGQPGGGMVIAPWTTTAGGVRLDDNGNLGVGTSNPAATLHVGRGNLQIGSFVLSDSAALTAPATLSFYKGPPNSQGGNYNQHYFDSCGDLSADNPSWQGCLFGGPTITVAGSPNYPRLSLFWDVDSTTAPTYAKGTIYAGNTNLASLHLASSSNLVQVDGTLNVQGQLNLNGIKAVDATGTASQAYYA